MVGVIVNLAVFFAIHVWWPNGLDRSLDPPVVISRAAFFALARFKAGVVPVIFACGLTGLALRFIT